VFALRKTHIAGGGTSPDAIDRQPVIWLPESRELIPMTFAGIAWFDCAGITDMDEFAFDRTPPIDARENQARSLETKAHLFHVAFYESGRGIDRVGYAPGVVRVKALPVIGVKREAVGYLVIESYLGSEGVVIDDSIP